MTVKHTDESYTIGKGHVRLTGSGSEEYRYSVGEYIGPEGTVSIYRQPPSHTPGSYFEKGFTRLDYFYEGRVHVRSHFYDYSRRYLPKLCRAFIADVKAGEAGQ